MSNTSELETFYLPDFTSHWPAERHVNPHYKEVGEACYQWWENLGFMSKKHIIAMRSADAALCVSIACPKFSPEHLQVAIDETILFFMLDAACEPATAVQALAIKDSCMSAFRNPDKPRPKNEPIWGEISRKWWLRALPNMNPEIVDRLISNFEDWFNGTCSEVANRENNSIPDKLPDYFVVRRQSIGCRAAFDLSLLPLRIPESVLQHPEMLEFATNAIDLGIFINDAVSYNLEQSTGDTYSLVNILMASEKEMSLQHAMDWLGKSFEDTAAKFWDGMNNHPSCGDEVTQRDLVTYKEGLRDWITSALYWSFECGKYFPKEEAAKIMKERKVVLLPKLI
ncbi:terpenoid synthase [Dendrothele bispora CBS 962.96]|uniref:Terpene synthase n=1 Tax=Dendrothele bispora (strain CBS 962.96) TaxID=1314807 RepID=A0A4S8MRR9_DENBC|nr:terpenoid synthase [Dendrothele bispora CBS 962.96]